MMSVLQNEIALTDEQTEAVEHLLHFPKQVQSLGGYAGTGKTTVIRTLRRRLPGFAVAAYTGKAANVLRSKGVRASTIHSRIYEVVEVARIDSKGRRYSDVEFVLKSRRELGCEGFIIDEASMVGRELYDDLLSFDLPLIFVGDHGQLEPVGSADFNLMAVPDVTLETIHRNAGEIAHFANFIREGHQPADFLSHELYTGERVKICTLAEAAEAAEQLEFNQIICAFNRTRVMVNQLMRRVIGYPADKPVIGDKLICLQNDRETGLFNGMQGRIVSLFGDVMDFESGGKKYRCRFVPEQFNNVEPPKGRRWGKIPFDYAYCISCHKAQGSEWDNVFVLEQHCRKWQHSRWAYTAASRAKESLSWVNHDA